MSRSYPVSDEQEARLARDEWARRRGREPYPHLVTVTLRMRGSLDDDALEAALHDVCARHDALRVAFERVEGAWRQTVTAIAPTLRRGDLTTTPGGDARERALARIASQSSHALFDVSVAPPARALLIRLGADDHALVLTIEHLVCDGWSMALVVAELGRAYDARARGDAPPLDDAVLQFPEFVDDERRRVGDSAIARGVAFWRARLAGAAPSPRFTFPFARRARPDERRTSAGTVARTLPGELVAALASANRRLRVTPFMVFTAALQALIGRYTGEERVVVPAPIAGRHRPGTERSVGWYATRIPVAADVMTSTTPVELVDDVRSFTLDALEHQDVQYARVVAELQGTARAGDSEEPSYDADVTINLITPELTVSYDDLDFGRLDVRAGEPPHRAARSTLAFTIVTVGGSVDVALRHDLAEVDDATAATILDDYEAALGWIAGAADEPVRRIRLGAVS